MNGRRRVSIDLSFSDPEGIILSNIMRNAEPSEKEFALELIQILKSLRSN